MEWVSTKDRLCPEDIKWKFTSSLAFTDRHHARYIDADFGLEMETITKKKNDYEFVYRCIPFFDQ